LYLVDAINEEREYLKNTAIKLSWRLIRLVHLELNDLIVLVRTYYSIKMKATGIVPISRLFFVITCIITGCDKIKPEQALYLKDLTPVVLEHKGNELFQFWEFENKPLYWGIDTGQAIGLKSYRDSLEIALGKDNLRLAVQKEAKQNETQDIPDSANGDSINAQMVHSGRVGKIRAINFLEAELLNYQLSRYPLLSHPTEFHGFILLNDSLNHIRVYFAASDQPWPPKPTIILDSIKVDLMHGWNLKYHLHNHYEPKSNNYIGILAPSLADAQYFAFLSEDFGLEMALITNGFHTVEIDRKEFSKFKSQQN